jgi:hypothetical protein
MGRQPKPAVQHCGEPEEISRYRGRGGHDGDPCRHEAVRATLVSPEIIVRPSRLALALS